MWGGGGGGGGETKSEKSISPPRQNDPLCDLFL